MGGRLFLLTCLVNLLKPVPNCSGTLMLSVYAKTQTSLQSSVPTTSTTPGQVIEATSKNYFRHNTGSTRKSRSGVSYRFSASPNFRLPLLGSPELPALQPLLRLPSCSPSYQPFSSAPSLPLPRWSRPPHLPLRVAVVTGFCRPGGAVLSLPLRE